MDRRDFVRSGVAAGATLAGMPAISHAASSIAVREFRLKYAPHFGMFKAHSGDGLVAELEFFRSEGFMAIEDNGMKARSVADQELVGKTLQRLGMTMGVFVAHDISWTEANLTLGTADKRDVFLKQVRESVDVAKRVNAKWITVVPGHIDLRLNINYQTANVIETLKRAAAIFEPHGLVMVLEPLNTQRDHPGMFLTSAPQGYSICKAVGSPACKILYDMYHAQIQVGNILPNLDMAWSEIAYLQIGDNPGRKEPSTGEMNYQNIFKHIHGKGFTGVLGMEHGNSRPGKDGERAVINAYVAADSWA